MSIDVKRLRELASNATPGPWKTWHPGASAGDHICGWDGSEEMSEGPHGGFHATGPSVWSKAAAETDAAFIAAANPKAVLALLDAYERMSRQEQHVVDLGNKRIAELEGEIERLRVLAEEACETAERLSVVVTSDIGETYQREQMQRIHAIRTATKKDGE